MCEIDLDGYRCELWNETERRARKQHKCDSCYRAIQPGERYVSHFSKFEGEVTTEKICADCNEDRKEFSSAHGEIYFSPGSWLEVVYDCMSEDEEDRERWQPMIDRVKVRRDAVAS